MCLVSGKPSSGAECSNCVSAMTSYDGGVYLEEVTATPLAVYTLLSLPQMRRQVAWAHVLLFSQRAGRAIISEWKILYHSGSVSPLFCRGWWHLHRKWLLIWKADLHRERERQRCCLIWLVKLECFESFAAIKLFGSEMCNHFSEQNSTACLFIYIDSFCTSHNNFKLSYESRLSCSKLLFPLRRFGGKMSSLKKRLRLCAGAIPYLPDLSCYRLPSYYFVWYQICCHEHAKFVPFFISLRCISQARRLFPDINNSPFFSSFLSIRLTLFWLTRVFI